MSLMDFSKLTFRALVCALVISRFCCPDSVAADKIVKALEVRYVGAKTLSEQRILAMLSTRKNEPLSDYRVDTDIKALLKSGEVRNARMLSEEVKGGVKVIVIVECSPLFGSVAFSGNNVFSDGKLAKTVNFDIRQPIGERSIRIAREDLLTLYRKRGYSETTIDYSISEPNASGLSRIVFQINERRAGVLRKVSFVGNNSISASDLKGAMKQKERGVQNLIGSRGLTDPTSIADDIRAIEAYYRDNGFFEATVVRVAKIPVDRKYNDLMITIDEGKGHNLSRISIDGVTALSLEKDIAPYLKTQTGKPFSAEDLEADIKMITDQYRARGFINAEVVPVIESVE